MRKSLIFLILCYICSLSPLFGANKADITFFLESASNNYMSGVEDSLEKGFSIDSKGPAGQTALMRAALWGHNEIVKLLIDKGARVDLQDKDGNSALILACRNGREESALTLIKAGADVNLKNSFKNSALHWAFAKDLDRAALKMLPLYKNINEKDNIYVSSFSTPGWQGGRNYHERHFENQEHGNPNRLIGRTIFHHLCAARFYDQIPVYLGKVKDINERDGYGITPLHSIIKEDNLALVKSFVAAGADVNNVSRYNNTPLHRAIIYGAFDTVVYLLEKGARISPDHKGKSSVLYEAIDENEEKIFKYLLEIYKKRGLAYKDILISELFASFDYHVESNKDYFLERNSSAWTYKSFSNTFEYGLAQLLLEEVGQSDTRDEKGRTLLIAAAASGNIEFIKRLITNDNINQKDERGNSALHWAVYYGHQEVVELLLANGADPNIYNKSGVTPLMTAAWFGDKKTIDYLIEKGANPEATDKEGVSAYLYGTLFSYKHEHEDFPAFLNKKGIKRNSADETFSDLYEIFDNERFLEGFSEKDEERILSWMAENEKYNFFILTSSTSILGAKASFLYWASFKKLRKVTTLSLQNIDNTNYLTYDDPVNPAFENVCNKGWLDLAELMTDKRRFTTDSEKVTRGLYAAIAGKKESVVNLILKKYRRLTIPEDYLDSFIKIVGTAGNEKTAKWLAVQLPHIDYRVSSIDEYEGATALMVAADQGNKEVVEYLLKKNASLLVRDDFGFSPLGRALDHPEVAKLLINRKAPVDSYEVHGYPLLYWAIINADDNEEIPLLLIERGTPVNAKSDSGTNLTKACDHDLKETAKRLVAKGAFIEARDYNNNTPLINSASTPEMNDLSLLLIKKGANVNAIGEDGVTTPLTQAVRGDNIELAKVLIQKGAEINLYDSGKLTPLARACQSENIPLTALLLEKGADPNLYKEYDDSPLYIALFYKKNLELSKLLVEGGADQNMKDSKEQPLLYKAAKDNKKELFSFLLNEGAKLPEEAGMLNNLLIALYDNSWHELLFALLNSIVIDKEDCFILKRYRRYQDPFRKKRFYLGVTTTPTALYFYKQGAIVKGSEKLPQGMEVKVEDIDNVLIYHNGTLDLLYEISTDDGQRGVVPGKNLMVDYTKHKGSYYGFALTYRRAVESENLRAIEELVYMKGSTVSRSPLDWDFVSENGNEVATFKVEGIKITDFNHDNIPDIKLNGSYSEGIIDSGLGIFYSSATAYFNVVGGQLKPIIIMPENGELGHRYITIYIEYKELDKDKDGFIETIKSTHFEHTEDMMAFITDEEYKSYSEIRKWQDGEYKLFKQKGRITVNRLRMRSKPNLKGDFIRYLALNEQVKVVAEGPYQKIDGKLKPWVKIETADGTQGWCYGGYVSY